MLCMLLINHRIKLTLFKQHSTAYAHKYYESNGCGGIKTSFLTTLSQLKLISCSFFSPALFIMETNVFANH